MAESGIAYVITGPDGTRAVLGNCDAAKADPDFVGYLDPENPITGLLDGAEVREDGDAIAGGDGHEDGPYLLGRRPGTIQGLILPNNEMAAVNAAWSKLKRATRALLADGTIRWTPSGSTDERVLRFRRQAPPLQSGRRPKSFQLALVSPDPYVLSSAESSLVIAPGSPATEQGMTSPLTSPITSALSTAAAQLVTNRGDAPTWPRLRVTGPIKNPILVNNSTGQQVKLIYTLQAGEFLDLVPERGAILLGGTTDRYSALAFTESEWWQLQPGANDVRLLATEYSAGAQLSIYWRHAWE